jgi:ABC-type multidrug transport system fused ATPase/permease subunit
MQQIFKNTLALLLPSERKQLLFFSLADLLISIADIALLAALLALVNFYIHPAAATQSYLQSFLQHDKIVFTAGALLLFFIIKNAAAYYAASRQYQFVYKVASRLSEKKMLQFLEGSYPHYVKTDTAVLIKQIGQQPVEFAHYILSGWQQMITQLVLIILTLCAIVIFSPALFLILFLLLLPPVLIVSYLVKRKIKTVKVNIKNNSETALQYLKEALSGFIESNLYSSNSFFTKRYGNKQQQLNHYLSQLQGMQTMPGRLMEVFAVAGLFALIVLNTVANTVPLPLITIGAFMAAAYKIIPGMVKIINCSALVKTYAYTLKDLAGNETPGRKNEITAQLAAIEFKNVSFQYKQQPILSAFDCTMAAGDFIGIAAASGKGKTTLINLLLGLEETGGGTILFNGMQQTAAARQQYWNGIAYVKQQPFLIHDTIESNIILGQVNPDLTLLNKAAGITGLQTVAAQYPEGLKKIITENGKNISGGQRQRIALARAVYKNAGVIILDEPFSEMDTAAENNLLNYFRQQAGEGKIVILITHNKDSLAYCNKTILLDEQ